jgi:superfamily II DNA or RNA helicase/predicted RNA methylase
MLAIMPQSLKTAPVFLLKADQLGLFDKLVPIAASITKKGVVIPAHTGIRHIKRPDAPRAKAAKAKADEAGDLFADRPPPPPKAPDAPAPADKAHTQSKPPPTSQAKELAAEKRQVRLKHKDGRKKILPAPPSEADIESSLKDGFKPDIAEGLNVDVIPPFNADKVPKFGVEPGITKGARRAINAKCVEMISDGRAEFGPDDLATLRQYSGNGGCGDSLNQYYTDPKVCAAMWHVLRGLGLPAGATVLEPSVATGAFIATAPAGVKVTGVELDGVSARIGSILHPGHEIQDSSLEAFAVADTRQFDAVIGNPPYGLRGSLLKEDKPDLSTAQSYFVDTSLDKTKPGGITALVIPTGIMDSANMRSFRQRILAKAEFIGALRMPRTAFEASHTEVTTDVVFFRKRPQDVANALVVSDQAVMKNVGAWDDEFLAGGYFTGSGAENVLGKMVGDWRAEAAAKRGEEGGGITVEGSMQGVPDAIAAFTPAPPSERLMTLADVLAAAPDGDQDRIRSAAAKSPYDNAKRGDVKTVDGVQYVLEGEPLRWHRLDEFVQSLAVTEAQELAFDIGQAIEGVTIPNLADRVRAYVEAHGVPSRNMTLMVAAGQDRSLYHLIGAVKPDGTLSDVVEGRHSARMESTLETAATSLALESGDFTPEQLAGRWTGGDSEAALDQLYANPDFALDPETGRWTTIDQYLSGELWPKVDALKAALDTDSAKPEDKGKYERQLSALEEAIDPKSLEDVEILLNTGFLPTTVVAAFFNEKNRASNNDYIRKSPEMVITFDRGVYNIEGGTYSSNLLDKYLNRTGIKKDDMPAIDMMNAEFKEWLCSSRFRDEIEDLYNRKFRGFRQRKFSNSKIEIPGLNDVGLKDYQYGGLRWALQAKKGIIAADVGLGKTVRGLMLARMAKVNGNAKKPLLIVPKSVLANWVAEAEKWFPGSSVMVIGETYTKGKDGKLKGKPDDAATRNRKFHDVTQNEYDFILISQPAWNDLELDPEIEKNISDQDFWNQRQESLNGADAKQVRKAQEAYEQSLAKRAINRRSDAIFFDQLGVDMIIGDEFHAFKNLYAAKNRLGQAPKFLGGTSQSKRALDMFYKSTWIREQNDGNNVYGLTATPTKNSPLEIYSMLAHIAPEAFENIGIRNSEEFLDRFCKFKMRNTLNTQQEIEQALCTDGFKNLGELREIMRRFIDRTTAEEVGLQLPARDDREHLIDMSAEQKEVYKDLRIQAAEAKGKDATGESHIFSIMHRMGQAALDLEIMDSDLYAGARSPLIEELATNASEKAKDGGQVIFCDTIAAHEKIADALVAKGVPRDKIGILNAQVASSSAQRQNISDAFNARKLWAVIGNTAVMGEGVNLQMGTTDIHHGDLPWEPASMQQRNGRGLRQGNTAESVRIHAYLPKGSFYGYRWQSMLSKKDWQDLLWNGGDEIENLAAEGSLSRDEMMVMLSEDPDKARKDLAENKAIAEQQYNARRFGEAADSFGKYRQMRSNYAALKKKNTPAADRLRVKLARLKIALEADDHFHAKDALDSNDDVIIQPQNGMAFRKGVAFEIPHADNVTGGRYVSTGAYPKDGENGMVAVRPYGGQGGSTMRFKISALAHAKAFEYDAKAEEDEIGKAIAAAAASGAKSFRSFHDLRSIPSGAMKSINSDLQKIVKDGIRSYNFNQDGSVALLDKDGSVVVSSAYGVKQLLDTHDVMMPTDENREKAIEAFISDQANVKFQKEYTPGRSRYSNQITVTVKPQFPSARSITSTINQWVTIGDNLFGTGFAKEAGERFQKQQFDAARHAKTFGGAVLALAPTAIGEYGTMGAWPRKALAVMWAHAKRAGILNKPMKEVIHETPELKESLPGELFAKRADGGNLRTLIDLPVGEVLTKIAVERDHRDMAAAMILSSPKGVDDKVKAMFDAAPYDRHMMGAVRHLIEKNPGLGDKTPAELGFSLSTHSNTPLIKIVDKALEAHDRHAA